VIETAPASTQPSPAIASAGKTAPHLDHPQRCILDWVQSAGYRIAIGLTKRKLLLLVKCWRHRPQTFNFRCITARKQCSMPEEKLCRDSCFCPVTWLSSQ